MDQGTIYNLKKFIENYSKVIDLQFNPSIEPKLPIDPYSKDYNERNRTAHYLLLVASINEGNIVGVADNARILIAKLYEYFNEDLFKITDEYLLKNVLYNIGNNLSLSRLRGKIPEILTSVNRFVIREAGGDLINYSRMFQKPYDFVEQLGYNIPRMGKSKNSAKKKSWMYMRWMVRGYPDLRIFDHFSPKDLFVPLDKNVARVALSLRVIKSLNNLSWREVISITKFAKTLFPEDPAKVDYPFFLLGRKIRELNLSSSTESLKILLNKPLSL